ncbi:hypothetical protein ISN44_As13g020400 [Arabidopsis suecica]|uniref:Uncharacterized protein n=1 Tax=Arabidopsis suecica TaxID=45249 RepID=A0A8T1XVL7_ARASU|nr:hypothetical protein ISN44_As13g020400 [Arabidopsis suecica]
MEEMWKKEDETAAKEVPTTKTIVAGEDDEYTPDEIMKLVESSSPTMTTTDIEGTNFTGEGGFRVRFIDDPYAVPVVVQSSSGYITINVNEESCGPSFSDSDSSVMASVDASGLFGCCFEYGGEKGGAWSTNEVRASEYEWNDDMLARFLGEDCV